MIRIGVQVGSLRLPLKQALPKIAAMGAQGVEIDARHELRLAEMTPSAIRQLRKWLDDYGLRVSAIRYATRRGYDTAEDLQRRIDGTKQAMQFAAAMGCPQVLNSVGQIATAESDPDGWHRLLESLADLGKYGHHVGAWLAATTGTESGSDMLRLIQTLPEGSLQVNLDPGTLIANGHSATDAVRELAPYVGHVTARDGVTDRSRGRGSEVPLGRGSVDFVYLISVLSEFRYSGFWTVARETANDPLHEVRDAVEFLKNVAQG